jgi:hypothetical protein
MAYILNNTNGVVVATVQDAVVDNTTDLTFIGRNYSGYGEIQNENFLKLLENFSKSTAPSKPVEGQIWYDSTNKKINIYDGEYWKGISKIEVAETDPVDTKNFVVGDLWYNTDLQQLYAYNGNVFNLIGPPGGADLEAGWKGSYEYSTDPTKSDIPQYNIKAVVGLTNEIIAVVSDVSYVVASGSDSYPVTEGSVIRKGITLIGSDSITGSSAGANIYFWGTAAEALISKTAATAATAATATTATEALTSKTVATTSTTSNTSFFIPLVSTTTSTSVCYTNTGLQYNPSNQTLYLQNLVLSGSSQSGSSIGVGQTWQTMLSSQRSSGVTYTNSTGKPIMVSVYNSGVDNGVSLTSVVGGITVSRSSGGAGGDGRWIVNSSFIVPNGTTYSVTFVTGALNTTLVWNELR